jgi:hypothetical protein
MKKAQPTPTAGPGLSHLGFSELREQAGEEIVGPIVPHYVV